MLVVASTAVFMSFKTSDRVSLFAVPETVEPAFEGTANDELVRDSLDLKRLAHDFGAGGETVEAAVSGDSFVSDPSAGVDLSSVASTDACADSDSFDWVDTIESRWVDRAATGLEGRIGTAGMTGPAGRTLGCVGVCWDFEREVGTADDGVVG